MKKFMFLLLLAFAVNACSVDDGVTSVEVLLPVEDVEMPTQYTVDHLSTFMVKYRRPTDCHIFNGFYTETEGNISTIGIKAVKFNQDNCLDDDESLYEIPLQWTPTEPGEYMFKFWTGNTVAGEPIFIEHEIVVE
ncbi:MAG: hypothetical protein ITG00_03725 [Flavobacterium sp.]|nr:hypothetical protein [Flavobacterium sp.]